MATIAPFGTSCALCTELLYNPIGIKIVLPIATRSEPFCLLKFSINGMCWYALSWISPSANALSGVT